MRVILDTNVLVAALKSRRGASYAIVSQLPSTKFEIALTIPLYMEYQDALTRYENMSGAHTKEEIVGFLLYLANMAHRTYSHIVLIAYQMPKNEGHGKCQIDLVLTITYGTLMKPGNGLRLK